MKKNEQVEIPSAGRDGSLEGDPRWELARRIAGASALSRAPQLKNILFYIVRQRILRPDQSIDAFEIAHRALGRRGDFNPLDDSIVRVQMAHLRKRVSQYFATEGADEEMVLSIALGSYEPVFSRRTKPLANVHSEVELDSLPDKGQPAVEASPSPITDHTSHVASAGPVHLPEQPGRRRSLVLWFSACAATLVLGTLIGFHLRSAASANGSAVETSNPILRQFFAPGSTVSVVIADTALVTLQNTIHSDISVGQYVDPTYPDNVLAATPDPLLRSQLKVLTTSRYTSLIDADVVGQCSYWGAMLGAKTYVRFARYMHVRDFEQGNFIIVGSRRGNPWVSLFEPSLNFSIEEDPATHSFHFRNRRPRAGESAVYDPAMKVNGIAVSYVDIAVIPNLGGTGSVLLLNGLSSETNEAARNIIFNRELPPAIARSLGALTPNSRAEIFLQVRDLDKAESGWEVVSIRTEAS